MKKRLTLFALLCSSMVLATPTAVSEKPAAASPAAPAAAPAFKRENYFGKPVYNSAGQLQYVLENDIQTKDRAGNDRCVMVKVKNFTTRGKNENGRIRAVMWRTAENYAKEGTVPYRAISHDAKDAIKGADGKFWMMFKFCGLDIGEYSFFAHFDKTGNGTIRRVLSIPVEPYIFSNKINQGRGAGLTREGRGPPPFEKTLVNVSGQADQVVELAF